MMQSNRNHAITFGRYVVVTTAHLEFVRAVLSNWDFLTICVLKNTYNHKIINNDIFYKLCNENWEKLNPFSDLQRQKIWERVLINNHLTDRVSIIQIKRPELFPNEFNLLFDKSLYDLVFLSSDNETNEFDLIRNDSFKEILNRPVYSINAKIKFHFSEILSFIEDEADWDKYLAPGYKDYFHKLNGHQKFITMSKKDYIKWIRGKVGKEKIFLNYSSAIILNEKNQILLQRRNQSELAWGFPGGAIELGESVAEALHREIQEEAGIKIEIQYLLGVYSKYEDKYPSGDIAQPIVNVFVCKIIYGQMPKISDSESLEFKYFDIETLPRLYNAQQQDAIKDFINGTKGMYR
jgi:mutator protein MutT